MTTARRKNPKKGLSLEKEQPSSFQYPCHCHPLTLFFSTFTMCHMVSFTIFSDMSVSSQEKVKHLEGKDIYLFCSLMGSSAPGTE